MSKGSGVNSGADVAWADAPRKPDGRDRLRAAQQNAEALALEQGWGRLVSVGELGDYVYFNFADGSQVIYKPTCDPS